MLSRIFAGALVLPVALTLPVASAQGNEIADLDARMAAATAAQERGALIAERLASPASDRQRSTAETDAVMRLAEYLQANSAQACNSEEFTTVTLPADERGRTPVYLINAGGGDTSFPLGGHFRVMVEPDGEIGPVEPMISGCQLVEWDPGDAQLNMRVFVTEYEGGDHPNEIHTLVSSRLPMSMGVVTGDLVWPMAGGYIAPPVPAEEAGY